MSTINTYKVAGMSCSHCVAAVSSEIAKLPGVVDVAVMLADGEVTVTSDGPLDEATLAVAVDEAGYVLQT